MFKHRARLPLRVLLTTPNLDTAGSKYIVADLIKGVDRSLIRPSLCVQRESHTELEVEAKACVDEFIESPLRLRSRPLGRMVKQVSELANQFRHRFDVVHSFDYLDSWSEGAIMRRAGIPWVTEKTNFNWGNRAWRLRSLFARKIICKSHAQYAALFKNTFFEKRATVIHNGIKLARFARDPSLDVPALAHAVQIPRGALVLGCVAHLEPVKGHQELLQAFAQIVADHPNVYLVLVGGGDPVYQQALEDQVDRLGMSAHTRFLGRRSDVPALLHLFDGLILATRDWGRKEAFGVVLIEAMACGLPVIATRSGGPEDIVVPGQTGWLVSPQGEQPLVEAMREFVADEGRRQQFGQAGQARASALFSLRTMIRGYQDLYIEVARPA